MPRGRRKKTDDDAFETPQGPRGSIVDGDEGVKGGADKDDGLMSVKEFVGADGSEDHWRDVHWVYNNLWVKEVEAKDAPSAGAWFWLMDCRRSGEARAKFRDYYMKLAPSRKELDERARRADGGESVVELLGEIERALR